MAVLAYCCRAKGYGMKFVAVPGYLAEMYSVPNAICVDSVIRQILVLLLVVSCIKPM